MLELICVIIINVLIKVIFEDNWKPFIVLVILYLFCSFIGSLSQQTTYCHLQSILQIAVGFLFILNSLSACFCNQHPVDLLLQCFLSSCFPKGLQRSCLKALSPLQIVPSTIWRNAISLGNGCRCPFDKISVPSVFQKSYESDFVKIKKPTQFQLLQKSKIHRLNPLT